MHGTTYCPSSGNAAGAFVRSVPSSASYLGDMASLTSRLRFCRDHSLPAPQACCIAAHLCEAEAAVMIEALVDAIGKPAEGSGLRIDPDIEPDRLVAPHGRDRGGDGDSGDDSDGDGDNDRSNVLIGSLGWLQRAATRALSLARSGAGFACVRHDPANGRIGLLLRRCPALEVMLEQSGERLHFSAWLHGCSPPERAMAPPVGPRHLSEAGGGGEARGSELERCRLPLRAGWVPHPRPRPRPHPCFTFTPSYSTRTVL